jgi:hypothetical protein
MKRFMVASIFPLSLGALMGLTSTSWAAINFYQVNNALDDSCNVFVNGAFATSVEPNALTPVLPVPLGGAAIPGRTNILLRCSDGGQYAGSVESTWNLCIFTPDENTGQLLSQCQL